MNENRNSVDRKRINDIEFKVTVMHYGISWGKRQRVFPYDFQLHDFLNNGFNSPESPHRPQCITFILNAIWSITEVRIGENHLY